MQPDTGYIQYLTDELLREVDGITVRRMFNGHGLYRHGIFIGLVHDGIIFLKVDDVDKDEYERRGSKQFVYTGHTGKDISLSFWEIPADVADDAQEIVPWVMRAYEAALRNKTKKRSPKVGRKR